MKLRIVATSLVALSLSLTACKEKEKPKAPVVRPAKLMTIAQATDANKRYFPGKVEASDKVNLSFQVSGKLTYFPVLEGDKLKKGATIAVLDPKEFQYNVNQAQARYNLTKSQLARFETLHKKGYASGSDYDKKKSDFNIAKADLSQAEKDYTDTILRAPFDGVITKKYVKNYQQVKANENVVSFQDIDNIDIKVNIPENIIANMKRDAKKTLYVSFEAVANRKFPVKVKEFSAEADPQTQTYEAVLTMPAPKDVNILPGMTATLGVDIPLKGMSATKGVYLIPSSAVFKNEQGVSSVWIVNPQTSAVSAQVVKVGELQKGNIQILQGVKAGDVIVTAGVHFLHAGDKVRAYKD